MKKDLNDFFIELNKLIIKYANVIPNEVLLTILAIHHINTMKRRKQK